ncbi:MAG TPA: triphosphoribosyl-dephospho-CoA synthase [Burkholderiaceae bacterium]|nr:triphosphoribosyl-dephospho-CoA synthase [Burkholderiaceae bacterium]
MNGRGDAAHARLSYLRACTLDVAVRKPGNVSRASPGHGMSAALFEASARASVLPLLARGARVGERIERAIEATWAVAGCNTNLGIVLLCAPIAKALDALSPSPTRAALQVSIGAVLADLDLDDTRAAYRAIARARPAGLGRVDAQDVHDAPGIDLRAAMALAAERDRIARQYRDGYADLFEMSAQAPHLPGLLARFDPGAEAPPPPALAAAVQRVYLGFAATAPDSHIVRKHGPAVAQTVMRAAQGWRERSAQGADLDADPAFAAWDEALKADGLNPGTSADLTVAALWIAGLWDAAESRR